MPVASGSASDPLENAGRTDHPDRAGQARDVTGSVCRVELVEVVIWIAASFAAATCFEVVQFRVAGRKAKDWASERNLRLVEYRWKFPWPFEPTRYSRYHVVVEDPTGRRTEGLACFSGIVRRKFWVDFDGSGRGWRASA